MFKTILLITAAIVFAVAIIGSAIALFMVGIGLAEHITEAIPALIQLVTN